MLLNCGVGEDKIFESPFDCKEIQPIHPKQNHTWIFIGRTDAEAETPIIWPPDVKNYFLENTPTVKFPGWDKNYLEITAVLYE